MSTRPESVLSEATTLQPEQQQQQQQQQQQSQSGESQNPPARPQYYYFEKSKKGPQPDYVAKPKSKLSKFMAKFQSPAVKATLAAREKQEEEDIRKGVKTTQVSDVGRSSNGWAATGLINS